MTTSIDEPVTPEPVASPSFYRLTWVFTSIGIFVMLLVCVALILIASFHR